MEDHLPEDTGVRLPDAVKRAARRANRVYGKVDPRMADPSDPDPAPATPPEPPADAPPEPPADASEEAPPPAPEALAPEAEIPPAPPQAQPDNWEHRYLSMKGRFDQAQHTIGAMQEQLQELGDELTRTQAMIRNPAAAASMASQPSALLTPEDEQAYGQDIISLARRAARAEIQPELDRLQAQTQKVSQSVVKSSQQQVAAHLDQEIPDWQAINANPRWKHWLRLRDIYSGEVRQALLNKASQAGNAPQVAAFFKGFLAEEAATGNIPQPPPPAPQPPDQPAPRQAAVPLEAFAAPGRARPAPGGNSDGAPADKPSFTRTQIAGFYNDVRAGVYAGRAPEKDRLEQQIFAAQREGRVR